MAKKIEGAFCIVKDYTLTARGTNEQTDNALQKIRLHVVICRQEGQGSGMQDTMSTKVRGALARRCCSSRSLRELPMPWPCVQA